MTDIDWQRIRDIEWFLTKDEAVAIERSKRYKDDVSFLIGIIRSIRKEGYFIEQEEWRNELDRRKIDAIDDIIGILDKRGVYAPHGPCAGDDD